MAAILDFRSAQFLAILCLLGAPMLLIKFQLNWVIGFRKDVQNINYLHFFSYKCIGPIQMYGEANFTLS